MAYRYQAASVEGVIQLIAANYLRHGYYWYVTGRIPDGKSAELIDSKLIEKYQIDVSEWERRRRKKAGLANAHYLRFENWFIILVSDGHHKIKLPSQQGGEKESLRDTRRSPIKLGGYSLSYRRAGVQESGASSSRFCAHVRIEQKTFSQLKAYFESLAVHRTAEKLGSEIRSLPYARYAPIRRQLLTLARAVNNKRKPHGFETVETSMLGLRRKPVKVYQSNDAANDSEVAL
jgi:hypothetical protein